MQPTVSFLIPTYNAARYVEACLESCLQQTYSGEYDIVVVDDGSEDDTPAVVDAYARKHPRIALYRRGRLGIAESLNYGLHVVTGQFVARMDADDVCVPDRLAVQTQCLLNRPDVAVVAGRVAALRADGTRIRRIAPRGARGVRTPETLGQGNYIAHPSVMYRASVIRALGGYRSALVPAEDYDLWLRVSEIATIEVLPDVVVQCRCHPGQSSVLAMERQVLMSLAARVCAHQRRRSGIDPICDGLVPDRQWLTSYGVTPTTIDAATSRAYALWVGAMLDAGYIQETRHLSQSAFVRCMLAGMDGLAAHFASVVRLLPLTTQDAVTQTDAAHI